MAAGERGCRGRGQWEERAGPSPRPPGSSEERQVQACAASGTRICRRRPAPGPHVRRPLHRLGLRRAAINRIRKAFADWPRN